MSRSVSLFGGPPWGFRVTNDEELRPVVGKLLPGGRAAVSGLRIGDVIEAVDGQEVTSSGHAHSIIQAASGQLTIRLCRNPEGYHSTVRKEKLSSSVHNSPILERKNPVSVPSSPVHPRTNPLFRPSPYRQIRLDLHGARGGIELKRRLFEQGAKPPATDRLLQRKIQMGVHQGVPSESTTGYDSVCGDFAGDTSTTASGRTSPLSSIAHEEYDERTIAEENEAVNQGNNSHQNQTSSNMDQMSHSAAPQQWEMRTETHNQNPAQGNIDVPRPRSVAALRQAITTQLEMKSPNGAPPRPKTPSIYSNDDGRSTPLWNNSVKVFEGVDDSGKAYMGRVLDGPVPAHKFFQGVPPPSYNQCHSPAPSSCYSEPQSKPPLPPPKPARIEEENGNFLQNNQASDVQPQKENNANESNGSAETVVTVTDDGQTASDFYHSLYAGGGGERLCREIPQQPPLEKPYNNPPSYQTQEKPVDSIFGRRSTPNQEPPAPNGGYRDESLITSTSTINDPRLEFADMSSSCMSSFNDAMDTSFISDNNKVYPRTVQETPNTDYPEDPKTSPKDATKVRRSSMDLESSELLKSKSPAPFSYSSSNSDHYGTIRRAHTPVTPLLFTSDPSDMSSPPGEKAFSFSNDSGYGDARSPPSSVRPSWADDRGRPSDSLSTLPNSTVDSGIDNTSLERPDRPDSLLSFSTVDGAAPSESIPMSSPGSAPLDRRSLEEKPEMSLWYRNMFNKMHRLEPNTESVLRYQIRDQSPTTPTISRPLTPSSFVSRPPSRFECDVTPRRAKSVGRVVEPEPASPNQFAWQRARTTHFHVPSYKFRHEDPRACPCERRPVGEPCLRCGLPRKEPSWSEIDYLYKTLGSKEIQKEARNESTQSRIALRCITDRLDSTAAELEEFIERLDLCWKRSTSTPMLHQRKEKEASPGLAAEIAELKRLSKEELLFRQKAERLTEELHQEKQRRHGYVPSASPALQKDFGRFDALMNGYAHPPKEATPPVSTSVQTATAVYKFIAKSSRELSLNKGDVVRVTRRVDSNWLEGERNGATGIFPASYVQMDEIDREKSRMRAVYPFTARNSNEMSLKMDELVTYRRDIDEHWIEGSNHLGEIGIFPKSYVRNVEQIQEEVPAVIPNRPKTPLVGAQPRFDTEFESPPREIRPNVHFAETQRPTPKTATVVEIHVEKSSVTTPKVQDWREKHSSEGLPGMANYVPRGSETFRAVFAYRPEKEDELELQVNDIVFVVEKCDDGWFIGTLLRTGQFGTFPGNYVVKH